MIHTPLKLIDLELELLVLMVEIMQWGLQGQPMPLHRTWGLVSFSLGEWNTPSGVFSVGGGGHDPYLGRWCGFR